jgi:hypothetical protein
MVLILSQINPVHTTPSYLSKVHLNIILIVVSFLSAFSPKPVRSTCTVHLILHEFITRDEKYMGFLVSNHQSESKNVNILNSYKTSESRQSRPSHEQRQGDERVVKQSAEADEGLTHIHIQIL